jgi:hypothetical protein
MIRLPGGIQPFGTMPMDQLISVTESGLALRRIRSSIDGIT